MKTSGSGRPNSATGSSGMLGSRRLGSESMIRLDQRLESRKLWYKDRTKTVRICIGVWKSEVERTRKIQSKYAVYTRQYDPRQ